MKRSVACAVLWAAAACGDNDDGNHAPSISDLELTTAEDTPLVVGLDHLGAIDADHDIVTVQLSGASHGAITGGSPWTYTPARDFTGRDEVAIVVSDGVLATTATLAIVVTPINDAPVAGDDSLATLAGAALVVAQATLLGNDTDVDSTALRVTGVADPVHGAIAIADRDVVFTPAPGFAGAASFTYTVSDGALTDVATVAVSVGAGNQAPIAVDDTAAVDEDQQLVIDGSALLANDTDPDGNTIEVAAVVGVEHGTAVLDGATITFTPDANFHGSATFGYTVTDHAATATGAVSVTVRPVNDPPVAVADEAATDEDAPLFLVEAALLGNDSDIDDDTLHVTAVGDAVGGAVALDGGVVTFTPAPNRTEAAGFTYTVSDGALTATATVAVVLRSVDDPPVAVDDTLDALEDTPVTVAAATLLGNDRDPDGDALAILEVGTAVNGAVALTDGVVTFTPAPNATGPASFAYLVSDGRTSDVGAVVVSIAPADDPPVAGDDTLATDEDAPLAIPASALLANDSDIDGDALAVTAVQGALNGDVRLDGQVVTFTPSGNHHGTASFTYTISDGAATATAAVVLTVRPVNDPPVAVGDAASGDEDSPVVVLLATLLANDSDVEDDSLTVTAVGTFVAGTAVLSGDRVTFTPDANASGPASFTYTVSDGAATATATVAVALAPSNDAPVTIADAFTTPEDTALTLAPGDLTGNDTDVDGDTLEVVAVRNATSGSVAIVGPSIVFTPAADASGEARFEYEISDGSASASAQVTVTVTPGNDAPAARDDAVTTDEDTPAVIAVATLLGNDTDIDGDTLTVTAARDPVHGTVALSGGSITFTPDADFAGAAGFEYEISDGALTATARVTVTVAPVNDPPVAGADAAATAEDTPLIIATATLLGNDVDRDGTLTVTGVGAASIGTATLAGGVVTYAAPADFHGVVTFSYGVSDGALSATGVVLVTITPVNDPPLIASTSAVTMVDRSVPITLSVHDIDSATLTYEIVAAPAHGALAGAAPALTYQPAPGYVGADLFTVKVSDGEDASSAAAVSLVVEPLHDCGNGVVEAPEACDDGNASNGDGCDDNCTETACGNGVAGGFRATAVSLIWLGMSCENTSTDVVFRIQGQEVYRELLGEGCLCELAEIRTVTLNAPEVLALLDGPTSFSVQVEGDSQYLAWAVAVVEPSGLARQVILFDALGGGDAESRNPEICEASFDQNISETVSAVFAEECDDGNAADGDGCDANCTVPCAAERGADRAVLDPDTGRCYAAFRDVSLDFAASQSLCAASGGHLATIASTAESTRVRAVAPADARPWIGLSDSAVEGSFQWVTGEPLELSRWAAGEPSGGAGEHCVELSNADGRWSDTACNATRGPVVCELR